MDTNCEPVSRPGACGVLFRVRLRLYGYTVAAKATPIDFVQRLRWEAEIYKCLRPIQGTHVPVHLGNVDLQVPYFYEGIAELVHMMFLSFGGKRISQHLTAENRPVFTERVNCAAQAIHSLGVLHKDLMPRNILWNEETRRVMVVDFERAEVFKVRPALGAISANPERKRSDDGSAKRRCPSSVFALERRRAIIELRGIS
jgi:predicted Ser/Thr protein kinase